MITTDLPLARAHRFKSVEQDFSIELSLHLCYPIPEMRIWITHFLFSPCHLDFHVVWLGGCVIHLFFVKVSSLHKVSGQYIPEGFYECFETIVVDVMSERFSSMLKKSGVHIRSNTKESPFFFRFKTFVYSKFTK